MEHPKLINNISERVVDDIKGRLSKGTFVSIAAASFSIYAYEALKEELEQVEQLRFIFTSPAFIKDKSKKEKLAHIRMDFGGIMQSVWNRMGYVALYHILPLAAFSRF